MKKTFFLLFPLLGIASICLSQPRESLADRVRRAFSLVGRWEIIKMEVDRSGEVHNPNTVPETSMGQVSIDVNSQLGDYGHFDVAPGGAITGTGEVIYKFRVAAGTSSFSWGPVNLPIGAVAMMYNENGIRTFNITGNADLSARTIQLRAFQPNGNALNMIIRPGGRTFTSVLWPPMTNISATKVVVAGSSLMLRASGVLSGIKVTFEAVKYVDLAGLFTDLDQYIDNRVTNIVRNTINNAGNTSTTGGNNNTGTTTGGGEEGSAGPRALVAGSLMVSTGGTANVVFRVPQASANYAISLTPMNGSNESPVVTFSNKTATGFRIHVKGTGTAQVKIDWVVTPYTN